MDKDFMLEPKDLGPNLKETIRYVDAAVVSPRAWRHHGLCVRADHPTHASPFPPPHV